jgi:hypothetical protein
MSGPSSLFDDVVDQRIEIRRREMNVALTWCAVLLLGFVLVTLDVIIRACYIDLINSLQI